MNTGRGDGTGEGESVLAPSERLAGDLGSLEDFARELNELRRGIATESMGAELGSVFPRRINADQATVEKDLAKLVLALIDLVRQLLEKQAIRRVNAGSLSDEQIERMGETFIKLDRRLSELKADFGLQGEELNLNLGRIRDLG